jgi:hypothetical protein
MQPSQAWAEDVFGQPAVRVQSRRHRLVAYLCREGYQTIGPDTALVGGAYDGPHAVAVETQSG